MTRQPTEDEFKAAFLRSIRDCPEGCIAEEPCKYHEGFFYGMETFEEMAFGGPPAAVPDTPPPAPLPPLQPVDYGPPVEEWLAEREAARQPGRGGDAGIGMSSVVVGNVRYWVPAQGDNDGQPA